MTEFYLKMRYGEDTVQVEYLDMADPVNQMQFPELVTLVEQRDLPYPVVAIDGRLRAAGSADYYRVLLLVEEALAQQQTQA